MSREIMSSKRFSFTVESRNGKNIYRIIWENNPVDERVYGKIVRWIKRSTDYAILNNRRLAAFRAFLNATNKEFGAAVTIDQAIAVRNIVLKDKIIKNYARMNQNIEKIAQEYSDGHGILTLADTYDFPPLNLLRGILIHKGLSVSKIYEIFANKSDPKILLKGRDLQQYYIAERNDAESIFNQQQIAKVAAINETRVIDFFKSIGCKLLTQDDLAKSQTEQFGRPTITPDLLFIDEVYINGTRVHWIDYKDYIGTNIRFLLTSNVNQAAKYTEKWGPGALCFHRAYVTGLIIPGAILLDARALPITLK